MNLVVQWVWIGYKITTPKIQCQAPRDNIQLKAITCKTNYEPVLFQKNKLLHQSFTVVLEPVENHENSYKYKVRRI